MEKRLFAAIALSFVLLLSWSALVQKKKLAENPQTFQQKKTVPAEEKAAAQLTKITEPLAPSPLSELSIPNSKYIFAEPQGAIKEITFYNYQYYIFALQNSLLYGFNDMVFSRQVIDNKGVTYLYSDNNKKITKQFIFKEDKYDFIFNVSIENLSSETIKLKLPVALGTMSIASKDRMHFLGITVSDEEKIQYPSPKKGQTFEKVKFISLRDRYFCAIIEPEQKGFSGYVNKISNEEVEVGLFSPEIEINPGATIKQEFKVFIGPQDQKILGAVNPDWPAIVYFGKLDLIGQALLKILEIFYKFARNWGLAIIILSVFIYIILYPLTLKQMKSMKEMQSLQPQIEHLRQQYKDNAQRLNKEILELYKTHKVNPMGGCLPMILQIPIFFALYQVLSRTIALKGADFLWIKDLSEPDRLFMLQRSLPLLGNEINILPVLMAIGMFVQQKFTVKSMSGPQAEQQKMMTVIMPVLFGVLFYRMPSGLVLYWFVNSSLTLVYQIRVAKAK